MKILLVHNYYGSAAPSGENRVFEAERKLLLAQNHEVQKFTRHNDQIKANGALGLVQSALATPWNPCAASALRQAVEAFRPDVVHVHNTFPLLSPAIFRATGNRAARVLTLHNYRLFCPAAIPMRGDHVCTECLDSHSVLPALRHGCYRHSRLATIPLAMSVALHRGVGTWTRDVDAFITLTEFQRERMIAAGLPDDRVYVKPNFYPGNPKPIPWNDRDDCVVFAGFLTPYKGIEYLIRAWLEWGENAPELRVLGDGPLRKPLELLASSKPGVQIRFYGLLASHDAEEQIARAKLLVLPSTWFEGFPMVIREAFAFGTPVAVSAIGPLPSIVTNELNGVLFDPADQESLLHEVRAAWESIGKLERLAAGARTTFENAYTEDVNYHTLMDIYDRALARKSGLTHH